MSQRGGIFALCGLLALCALACSEDKRLKVFVYVPPNRADMGDGGPDGASDMPPVAVGPCATATDGSTCELTNATGVCVNKRCQLVACLSGSRDCDGDLSNGCEQDITTAQSCGQCERSCRPEESCQLGLRGYLCSAGVACSRNRYDIDFDVSTGCEWELGADTVSALQPVGFASVEQGALAASSRAVVVAGSRERSRIVAHDKTPNLFTIIQDAPLSDEPARSLSAIAPSPDETLSLASWSDLSVVTRQDADEMAQAVMLNRCVGASSLVGFLHGAISSAASPMISMTLPYGLLITTDAQLCLQDASCLETAPLWGEPDYLRAFWPYAAEPSTQPLVAAAPFRFGAEELIQCQPCLLDVQTASFTGLKACWDESTCHAAGDDLSGCDSACTRAQAGLCPRFEPRQSIIFEDSKGEQHIAAVTRRGLVLLSQGFGLWRGRLRIEEPFDPEESVGLSQGFVRGDVLALSQDRWRVALLHETGFLRVFEFAVSGDTWRIEGALPDIGLAIGPRVTTSSRVALGAAQTALVSDGVQVVLVSLDAPGGRQRAIRLEDGVAEYTVLDLGIDQGDYMILRDSFGSLITRTLRLSPEGQQSQP